MSPMARSRETGHLSTEKDGESMQLIEQYNDQTSLNKLLHGDNAETKKMSSGRRQQMELLKMMQAQDPIPQSPVPKTDDHFV